MADQAFTRRASYGPSSPTVGRRGAKTRREIVDAALRCFTENGFYATAIEDITALAETSRATLYQYFESKDAIFIELMYESGNALSRVTRRLGQIGPTAEGFDNLHWWLGEWSWVFDRYSSMFIEWANVKSPKTPLRPKLARFVDFHTAHFGRALAASGYVGTETSTAAILVLAVMDRFNYFRHVYRPRLTDTQLLDSLTSAIQLFLFPDTPASVLAAGTCSAVREASERPRERQSVHDIGPLAKVPRRASIVAPAPFDGVSEQAATTIRLLLDAAGRVFAANGYDAANIDLIVTEAALARGTFYRYFSDKLELIIALAHEAASVLCPLFEEFASVVVVRDGARLREWLRRVLAAQRRYSGVMRAWTEGFPIDPVLLAPAADVVRAMGHSINATFGPPRPYALDRRSVGMLFASLVEHFPNEGAGSNFEPSDQQIIEVQALFIERVLLPN